MKKRSLIRAGALVGAVASISVLIPTTALAATPALASAAPAAAPDEPGPRLQRACLRIPNVEIRTTNLIARLEGDATVRGSLAWLQTQIDRANANGRAELATVLENRLAVRTQTLEVLKQRQGELARLRQFCIDHGVSL